MIAVAKKENDPTQALLDALRHPLRRALLHRYVVADEPTSPKYLAHSMRQPLSSVSYHVRELAKLGALEIAEEEQRRGAVEHFYVVTPLITESMWALAAMGLRPPLAEGEPYLLTPEENRPILDRLQSSEEEESKKKKDKGK